MALHSHRQEIRGYARLISLLRLLLLTIALAVMVFFFGNDDDTSVIWNDALIQLQTLLGAVAMVALLLVVSVPLVTRSWQLIFHLVFDLLWIGYVIYLSGGMASPAVPLLFAVVLTGNLAFPRRVPFLISMAAGLVLAGVATFYLAGLPPFDVEELEPGHPLVNRARILGNLSVQVGALIVVDLLGQTLSRRLHEQRMLIDELIEQLGEGVIAIDQRGRVLYANDTAALLFGVLSEIPTGVQVMDFLGTSAQDALDATLGAVALPADARMLTDDGRYLVLRASYLRGRGGRIMGRTLVVADETRLHRAEEEAARAERLASMGQMAAGIAHEVRNPLASLRGCAQELGVMAREGGRPEDVAELSEIMVRESDRVARIVEEFLSLSRMRDPEPINLEVKSLLVEQAELGYRRADGPRGLEFTVSVSEDCAAIHADPDHVRQVLTNLVANAVEAMQDHPDPRIELWAESVADGMVLIGVRDNGPGIPTDQREQVFTPFYSTKSKGTGLGLSLVERLVRSNGGRVDLRQPASGGTEIRLRWPQAK